MKKTTALLLGSAAAVGMCSAGALATPSNGNTGSQSLAVQSYADLLEPIPNAVAQLKADDAKLAAQPERIQLAQFHHHHHHHHHHHGFFGGFGFGFGGPYYATAPESCYWTLGRPYWNGYRWVRRRVQVCD